MSYSELYTNSQCLLGNLSLFNNDNSLSKLLYAGNFLYIDLYLFWVNRPICCFLFYLLVFHERAIIIGF